MEIVSIYVSFIVAILAIAFPILFQVVSRFDEKYSSTLIIELFYKESPRKFFTFFLISSLASILLWALQLPPLVQFNKLDYLINNSAFLLLAINTILLVIFFFLFVWKILVYYTPTKFLKYLISKHINSKNNETQIYFKAISDILFHSIKQQNETMVKTIADFMYSAFQRVRESGKDKPIEYPISYYEVIYKSIEEQCTINNNKLKFLKHRTSGSIWLLGEFRNNLISETTYDWIWRNIQIAINYKKDDMVMSHWKNAHQFIS